MYRADAIDIPAFRNWLKNKGCLLIHDGHKGELVKFVTGGGVEVLITLDKKLGVLTTSHAGQKALDAFINNDDSWSPESLEFNQNIPRETIIKFLTIRDGSCRCVYCGKELSFGESTIEHIVPKSKGGLNNLHNMAISCQRCNTICSNLSVVQKIMKIANNKLDEPNKKSEDNSVYSMTLWCLIFVLVAVLISYNIQI